jgi:hypothetical protein
LATPLEPEIRDPSCATAFGARYVSQQVSRKGRKYLQSQRLRRFLGEYPGLSTMHKPLFMRRKYKGKRLTERTLKPNNMYSVQVAHIANA